MTAAVLRDGRAALAAHSGLVRTAGSLLGTTIVTSLLGFVYWAVAARLMTRADVGYGSSAVSAMTLVGTVGMLGLGTMLIGELGRRERTAAKGLVSAALLLSGLASAAIAVGVVVVFAVLGKAPLGTDWSYVAWFVVGSALTGATLVLDLALIGRAANARQLTRNTVFAAVKLVLLFVLVPWMAGGYGVGVLAAWIVGIAASLLVLVPVNGRGVGLFGKPAWAELRALRGTTAAHNWFNLAGQLPRLTLPILATAMVSGAAGGAFYAAWMIATFAYIVPTHLSTALFAIGAGRIAELRERLRFSLKTAALAGCVGVPLLLVAAGPMLQAFGSGYAHSATGALRILAVCYFPMIVKTHYVAVIRVQRDLVRGSVVVLTGAALEVVGAAVGAATDGIVGLSVGFLLGLLLEVAWMTARVLRAATEGGSGREPRGEVRVLHDPAEGLPGRG